MAPQKKTKGDTKVPERWVGDKKLMTYKGVPVYRTYRHGDEDYPSAYWFTLDPSTGDEFDVRDLASAMEEKGIPFPQDWEKREDEGVCQLLMAAMDNGILATPSYIFGGVQMTPEGFEEFSGTEITLATGPAMAPKDLFGALKYVGGVACFGSVTLKGLTLDDVRAVVGAMAKFKDGQAPDYVEFTLLGHCGHFAVFAPDMVTMNTMEWELYEQSRIEVDINEEMCERDLYLSDRLVAKIAKMVKARMRKAGRAYWTHEDVYAMCSKVIADGISRVERDDRSFLRRIAKNLETHLASGAARDDGKMLERILRGVTTQLEKVGCQNG